ncbi:fructosamine-3-kinase-like isoform X1 [Hyla sarda]|uniref:fructosamine-3-kinase-like isoform X1 n=1 Tax=Hyla sarda TaxID=327740 RepID=UPI0024C2DAD7|nr:fructosamine-3-kinase-like isoform X1 [Hyla sarda]
MEAQLKNVLQTSVLTPCGHIQGGCISEAWKYETDRGRVFVKWNQRDQAMTMFRGEIASLAAIRRTCTVRVPTPITLAELPAGGALLIMKCLELRPICRFAGKLGEQLADLHVHNMRMKMQQNCGTIGQCPDGLRPVDKFGFHTTTCCGYIPQENEWQEDWATFFVSQRLQPQVQLIEKDYGDRTLLGLWSELQMKAHKAFRDTVLVPSLLHGDLWEANVAEDDQGPVLFDPASFYGHSEFDLSVGEMFGEHCEDFYQAYHRRIPRSPGFALRRLLYQLFHSLNNWNHFGAVFRRRTLDLARTLLQIL